MLDCNTTWCYNNFPMTLLWNCCDLFVLWWECMFGILERKPARQFTVWERENYKFTYNRKKIILKKIAKLVQVGLIMQVTIDQIYKVYDRETSLLGVLAGMQHDQKEGWPNRLVLNHVNINIMGPCSLYK